MQGWSSNRMYMFLQCCGIYNLGMAAQSYSIHGSGVKDWGQFLKDASHVPEAVDCSDSDESIIEE